MGLFADRLFAGFGPNRLDPLAEALALQQVAGKRPGQLWQGVREASPRRPGVYGFVNEQGELIYVGKAKRLRTRLLSYFRSRGRPAKVTQMLRETRTIVWEPVPSEFGALLRELELIRHWQPRWNFQGQPQRRRRAFLCLGRAPAPYLFLSRKLPAGLVAAWGPVFHGRRAREAMKWLADHFGLRDCPQEQEMIFADQAELFPIVRPAGCIRHEIGSCVGPCTGAITQQAYAEQVQAARRFLDGGEAKLLAKLQTDMTAAAAALDFERAARLRDKLEVLRWLHQHLERIRQARQKHTFIYPVAGHQGQDLWYLVRQGWVAAAVPAPRDPASKRFAVAAIKKVFQGQTLGVEPAHSEGIDGVLLVSAWFRRHSEELQRTLPVERAISTSKAG